ncbi:MAG TPA: (4Fe-4S)-binding protein [Deltaproteobacteria bacterium]|nr:(4Fe-4S)-binding protein [Deltaproteobacteria bacterium]
MASASTSKHSILNFVRLRRSIQILFFAIFLILFVLTDYRGKDEIPLAVNTFFRLDPLVMVSYVFSAKTFTIVLLPAALVLAATMLFGRFFCGWFCPLGTALDLATKRIPKIARFPRLIRGNARYYVLLTLLFAALFNINIAGLLDPLAIFLRFLTFLLYPVFGDTVRQGWITLYRVLGDNRDYLDGGYRLFRDYVLPFRQTFYPLAFLSLIIFIGIFILELFGRRTWCRGLCPLGSLLSLAARFSLLKRLPNRFCTDCSDCESVCPAFPPDDGVLAQHDCLRCLSCLSNCKNRRPRFRFRPLSNPLKRPFSQERRVLVGGLASGFLLSRVFAFSPPSQTLLRPPGVTDEWDFLRKCVRCGECMKVCPRNALYPVGIAGGLYNLYTPMLVPRLGYCEYNCNLCSQVCPTRAIPRLPLSEKHKAVIGRAVVDRDLCLPYAKKTPCLVCEEHCPIPEKAIKLQGSEETDGTGRRIVLDRPVVDEQLCNGCGICEYVCPLEEKAAIRVYPLRSRGSQG